MSFNYNQTRIEAIYHWQVRTESVVLTRNAYINDIRQLNAYVDGFLIQKRDMINAKID